MSQLVRKLNAEEFAGLLQRALEKEASADARVLSLDDLIDAARSIKLRADQLNVSAQEERSEVRPRGPTVKVPACLVLEHGTAPTS